MRAWATVFKFCVFSQARGGSLTLGQHFTKLIPGRFGGRFISGEHIQLGDFPVAQGMPNDERHGETARLCLFSGSNP